MKKLLIGVFLAAVSFGSSAAIGDATYNKKVSLVKVAVQVEDDIKELNSVFRTLYGKRVDNITVLRSVTLNNSKILSRHLLIDMDIEIPADDRGVLMTIDDMINILSIDELKEDPIAVMKGFHIGSVCNNEGLRVFIDAGVTFYDHWYRADNEEKLFTSIIKKSDCK